MPATPPRILFSLQEKINKLQMGLWRLFKELGAYPSGYGTFLLHRTATYLLGLDPIECAGHIRIEALRKAIQNTVQFSFLALAFFVLLDPKGIYEWLAVSHDELPMTHTSAKWWSHIQDLVHYHVLELIAEEYVKSAGGYFAIPKSEDVARAIWNGRPLSRCSRPPPPVNFPDLREVLRRSAALTAKSHTKTGPTIIVGDFRHFFHQIRCSPNLSQHFCVITENQEARAREGKRPPLSHYRWRTLPMGWAWSPFIAQSVGLSVLLHHEKGERELFELPIGLSNLPTYIHIVGGGLVCLYLDNIFAIGIDHNTMQEVE